jgi:hypothetical protein
MRILKSIRTIALLLAVAITISACGGGSPTGPTPPTGGGTSIAWTTIVLGIKATPDTVGVRKTVEFYGEMKQSQDGILQHVKWVVKYPNGTEKVAYEYDQPTQAFSGTTQLRTTTSSDIMAGEYEMTCTITETYNGQPNPAGPLKTSAKFKVVP